MSRLIALSAITVLAGVALASPARADDRRACLDAYRRGQEQKLARHYSAARDALIRCADRACPRFMQSECAAWLSEVESAASSIVIDVHDSAGREKRATALTVDGVAVTQALDGRALDIDPGAHDLAIVVDDGAKLDHHIVVREGEKRRRVDLVVAALAGSASPASPAPSSPASSASPAASSPTRAGIPAVTWGSGAVTVVALGSFAFFAISGVTMQHNREGSCAPRCPQSDVDALRAKYLVADVSLAVALVAGAVTGWAILSRDTSSATTAARAPTPFAVRF